MLCSIHKNPKGEILKVLGLANTWRYGESGTKRERGSSAPFSCTLPHASLHLTVPEFQPRALKFWGEILSCGHPIEALIFTRALHGSLYYSHMMKRRPWGNWIQWLELLQQPMTHSFNYLLESQTINRLRGKKMMGDEMLESKWEECRDRVLGDPSDRELRDGLCSGDTELKVECGNG